jgi:hypothetical protein
MTNGGGVTLKSFSEEESGGKGARGVNGRVRCPQRDVPGLKAPRRLRVGFGSAVYRLARVQVLI